MLLYLGHCAVATIAACLWFWQLVFGVSLLPSSPNPLSNRSVLHDGRKHKTVVFSQPNALREYARRTNLPLLAIGCRADCSGERRTSPFNGIESSLSRTVVTKTKSLPVSATTFPTALSLYIAHDGSISIIQRSPRISTSHKFAAPCCRLPPMVLQTVQVSVEPRLSTALKDRSVVPYSSPKVSARLRYHVSNSVLFVHRAGTLAKGYPLFKLFSRAEPVPFEKEININLVYSSCLKHANEMLLGDPRQADQRMQSFHFPIVIHRSLDPAARSSAQAPSSLSLHAIPALDV